VYNSVMEKTYIMIKPDAMAKEGVAAAVKQRITDAGFVIENEKVFTLTKELVEDHYDFLVEKPFFPEILEFMTSGPVTGMIVVGENVVAKMREIIGVTNPANAAPGTIRAEFGTDVMRNVVHGSEDLAAAEIEIKRFFG